MAVDPAWSGVVGAVLGGAVAWVSQLIKGKQDAAAEERRLAHADRVRAEEHAWAVRGEDRQERRQLYAKLLSAAEEAIASVQRVWMHGDSGERLAVWTNENVNGTVTSYRTAVAGIHLVAVSQEITDLAERIEQVVTGASWMHSLTRLDAYETGDAIAKLVEQELPQLRDACRADLNLQTRTGL
jgi:hypothetical protein